MFYFDLYKINKKLNLIHKYFSKKNNAYEKNEIIIVIFSF